MLFSYSTMPTSGWIPGGKSGLLSFLLKWANIPCGTVCPQISTSSRINLSVIPPAKRQFKQPYRKDQSFHSDYYSTDNRSTGGKRKWGYGSKSYHQFPKRNKTEESSSQFSGTRPSSSWLSAPSSRNTYPLNSKFAAYLQFFAPNCEKNNSGFMDVTDNSGVQDTLLQPPQAVAYEYYPYQKLYQGQTNGPGRKRRKGQPQTTSLHQLSFWYKKENGEFCPVINLRVLNRFLGKESLKNPWKDCKLWRPNYNKGTCMMKLNLKDAYYAIPIHSTHRKYLKFVYQDRVYEFQCLPFGLFCSSSL